MTFIITNAACHALVVEDDEALHELLGAALQSEGFRASYATRRGTALKLLLSVHLDLVLVDIGLPDGSGAEVAKRATQLGIPCIAMSGRNARPDGLATISFLPKPIRLATLSAEIRHLRGRTATIAAHS
jgi:DNA-binding response OmpR family regulator